MPYRRGFTLIEVLIVVTILGILAGILLPRWEATITNDLRSAAEIVMSDLAYGRNLAVTNNSSYTYEFDANGNRYYLEHSGDNTQLDVLPNTPFSGYGPPSTRQTHLLNEMFHDSARVQLVGIAARGDGYVTAVTNVEFGPLGNTTRSDETVVWLGAGSGDSRRYISIHVTAVTGLSALGQITTELPADAFDGVDPHIDALAAPAVEP